MAAHPGITYGEAARHLDSAKSINTMAPRLMRRSSTIHPS
jgi:hypothetical protein